MEWQRNGYTISTDPARLDLAAIHRYLSEESYWAAGRPADVVERSIANSIAFGVYRGEEQAGFGRVVTDRATFAWIADVFILEAHRGRGLSKWLMDTMLSHPELQGFRRWVLATKDAHALYSQFGFEALHKPERWMERKGDGVVETPDYWTAAP